MKKFNPDKELSKIRNGNKNKIILGLCTLLLIVVVSYSFALYQVRHTQKLVFNTVGEFKKRDIYLSVLVDGETKSEFPGKNDGYVFDNIQCDKPGIEASFNNDTWKLTLTTGTTNKCTVKFITKPYMDESGANYPDLFQGLIPIRFDNNKIYIADYKEKWYDYNNNEWANAVLIDHTNPEVMKKFYTDGKLNVNTEITTEDILQMYVWIPRYKYKLWNENNEAKPEQMIDIEFENTIETTGEVSCTIANNGKETCINAENGKWYTHPSFTFGDTELRGIWVGKFEISHLTKSLGTVITDSDALIECINETCNESEYLRILPNKSSLRYNDLSDYFFLARSIEKENNIYGLNSKQIDTHMMKNMDWGVVAYLTQSKYGACYDSVCQKVEANISINMTGYSGSSDAWNTENGMKASTTWNISGIYDMNGTALEYVMGNVLTSDGYFNNVDAGFISTPDDKYYDKYEYGTSLNEPKRGHLGDSTREVATYFGSIASSWYDSGFWMPRDVDPWFGRGDWAESTHHSLFRASSLTGIGNRSRSIRIVITSEDNF